MFIMINIVGWALSAIPRINFKYSQSEDRIGEPIFMTNEVVGNLYPFDVNIIKYDYVCVYLFSIYNACACAWRTGVWIILL